MSERITLEQLKAMDDETLKGWWREGHFPFDLVKKCCMCMTMHAREVVPCDVPEHSALVDSAQRANIWHNDANSLRKNLEEIYALRLFYDSLFAPAEPTPPTAAIADAEEFRAKHGLSDAIPAAEIAEVMQDAELGLLPKICPACATKHGEQQCWGQGCECACTKETTNVS